MITEEEKKFILNYENEKNIEKIMIEYFKIFKKKLTSKKYKELFFDENNYIS
jgi:hypothetical protein